VVGERKGPSGANAPPVHGILKNALEYISLGLYLPINVLYEILSSVNIDCEDCFGTNIFNNNFLLICENIIAFYAFKRRLKIIRQYCFVNYKRPHKTRPIIKSLNF
jgi:hypothetical protein